MDELLGVYLKKIRESKKSTLDDIAKETKIQKRYLEAIEANMYDDIPGETYLRGFLRNYATAVGLNPEIIIEKYDMIKNKGNEIEHIEEQSEEEAPKTKEKSRLVFNSVAAFLVLGVFYINWYKPLFFDTCIQPLVKSGTKTVFAYIFPAPPPPPISLFIT